MGVAGTSTNCAGGITPWGTWLTCEEDSTRAGTDGATKDHGYVFEVDPFDRTANRDPQPENITVSPWGGLILAEDGEGVQHLGGVSASGETFPMARNDVSDVEFTGPVYSPDKKVLLANVQDPGAMFAITGPWRRRR